MRVTARRTSSWLSTRPGARAGRSGSSRTHPPSGPHGTRFTVGWHRTSHRRDLALIGVRGTVVMATYNEAASIGPVLAELDEAATALRRAGIELNVLLVDDDSPDGTAAVARREAERFGLPLEVIAGPWSHPRRGAPRRLPARRCRG